MSIFVQSVQCLIFISSVHVILFTSINGDCNIDTNLRNQGIEVFEIGDTGYNNAKEQYGETAIPFADNITPTIIAFAASATDAQIIVNFVNQCNDINEITVRSGGHQYSGLSSCSNNCLQLDVSKIRTFEILDPDYGIGNNFNENINNNPIFNNLTSRALIRVGAGWSYKDLYTVLVGQGINFVGGTCADVFVGGNYQSSGHGSWVKALGSGMDWIKSFDIVLSNGTLLTVDPSDPNASGDIIELAWANKGGSPGAFGVVISYDVEVFYDINFPNSGLSYTYYLYSKETLQAVLNEYNSFIQEPAFKDTQDFGNALVIVGTRFDDGPEVVRQILEATGSDHVIIFATHYLGIQSNIPLFSHSLYNDYILGRLRNPAYNPVLSPIVPLDLPIPPSQRNFLLTPDWLYWDNGFRGAMSADYFSNDFYFNWAEGVDQLINEGYYIVATTFDDWGSNFLANDPDNVYTAHPHRDTSIFLDMWNRIIPNDTNYKNLTENAQNRIDELFDNLSEDYLPAIDQNKKWLMYTYGETDIEQVWPHYYDSVENYIRLRVMKYKVDPNDLFNTPFTVNPLNPDSSESSSSSDSSSSSSSSDSSDSSDR